MHDQQHAPAGGQLPQAIQHPSLSAAVKVRGRFVQQEQPRAALCPQERPCQRHPLPLPGRQAGAVLAEHARRVDVLGGASASARRTSSSVASGAPSRTLSATVPASRAGRCGAHATCARHCSMSASARSTPPTRTVPPDRRRKPSSTASRVDLPAPLGPTSATISPGFSSTEVGCSSGGLLSSCRTVTSSISRPSAQPGGTGSRPTPRSRLVQPPGRRPAASRGRRRRPGNAGTGVRGSASAGGCGARSRARREPGRPG